MFDSVLKVFKRLHKDEKGLTLVEYGVGAILAVTVGAIALTQLGAQINHELGSAEGVMESTATPVGGVGGVGTGL